MSIVTHSISKYEFVLLPGEWRIVFLFRNVWNRNVEYLRKFGKGLNEEEEKNNMTKKRKRNNNNNNNVKKRRKKMINKKQQEVVPNLFNFDEEDTEEDFEIDF